MQEKHTSKTLSTFPFLGKMNTVLIHFLELHI